MFVIRTRRRDNLRKYLENNSIQTVIHYPVPPHKQRAYKELNNLSFPVTEKIYNEILSLPIGPVIEVNEIEKIVDVVNAWN